MNDGLLAFAMLAFMLSGAIIIGGTALKQAPAANWKLKALVYLGAWYFSGIMVGLFAVLATILIHAR